VSKNLTAYTVPNKVSFLASVIHSILVSRMMHANKVVDNLRAHSYSMILIEAISIPHHKDGDA
jgi:hypothetical protein